MSQLLLLIAQAAARRRQAHSPVPDPPLPPGPGAPPPAGFEPPEPPLQRDQWPLIQNRYKTIRYPRPNLWPEVVQPQELSDCSPLVRYIAFLYYTLGQSDDVIARGLGLHRTTVTRLRHRVLIPSPAQPHTSAPPPEARRGIAAPCSGIDAEEAPVRSHDTLSPKGFTRPRCLHNPHRQPRGVGEMQRVSEGSVIGSTRLSAGALETARASPPSSTPLVLACEREVPTRSGDGPVVTPLSIDAEAGLGRWVGVQEVRTMARRRASPVVVCPHCEGARATRNGHKAGRQRWRCQRCQRTFGDRAHTALYRLRTPPEEVARTLVVALRWDSLGVAETLTGHKAETVGRWLRRLATDRATFTAVLVDECGLTPEEEAASWTRVCATATRGRRPAPRPFHAR